MGSKAQVFTTWIFIITVVMISLAIMLYMKQQKDIVNSIASPVPLLKFEDSMETFNQQERIMIKASGYNSLQEGFLWGSKEFEEKTKNKFIEFMMNESNRHIQNFIFSGFILNNQVVASKAMDNIDEKKNFLYFIYNFSFENDKLRVERKIFGKNIRLEASQRNKINFVNEMNINIPQKVYSFEKQEISKLELTEVK